jgi:hypothetical protein
MTLIMAGTMGDVAAVEERREICDLTFNDLLDCEREGELSTTVTYELFDSSYTEVVEPEGEESFGLGTFSRSTILRPRLTRACWKS